MKDFLIKNKTIIIIAAIFSIAAVVYIQYWTKKQKEAELKLTITAPAAAATPSTVI